MSILLFGEPGMNALHEWNPSDFTNVDDTVRGGSSKSEMKLVIDKRDEGEGNDSGSIDFIGYLDTTTLGGAGFASQAYSNPFPGKPLQKDQFAGLRLTGRRLYNELDGLEGSGSSTTNTSTYPGGGKGPVTTYVLNIKNTKPEKRPDGRRESTTVYEWDFDVSNVQIGEQFNLEATWKDFKATYRGRPVEDAPELDPSQAQEWSIMARSDFGKQSGPFAVRLIGLSAEESINQNGKRMIKERADVGYIPMMNEKQGMSGQPSTPSYIFTTTEDSNSSGEYYGFALFIFATMAFFIWIGWALVPDKVLRKIGIDWYPNREWAFLLPAWSLFAVLFVYAAFICLNIHNNPDLDDLRQVVDSHSNILPISEKTKRGEEDHPLLGITNMAQTGQSNRSQMAQDIYEIPPGIVSRERHGLDV